MKKLMWMLVLAAGCDLKPAPEGARTAKVEPPAGSMNQPAPAGEPPPAPPPGAGDRAPPPPPPAVDAGVPANPPAPDAPMQVADDCVAIGDKIAGIIIEGMTDATQKAAFEQDRAKFVRRMAETCTTDVWPATAKACFNAAKTPAEVQQCGTSLAAPR